MNATFTTNPMFSMDAMFEIIQQNSQLPVRYMYSNNQGPSYVLPHFHSEIEILYLLTGSVTINRGVESTLLHPGDFVVFTSNEIHSTQSEDATTTAFVLQISYDFLTLICGEQKLPSFHIPLIKDSTPEKFEHIRQIQQLIRSSFDLCKESTNYTYIKLKGLISLMFYELYENFKENKTIDAKRLHKNYTRISKIDMFLKEHYHEDITLDKISTYTGLTPAYFSRFFKEAYGIPFTKYLSSLRLEYAKNDLLSTNLSILNISEKNGFANYQLFLQSFKQMYGCTPITYRKKYQVHP